MGFTAETAPDGSIERPNIIRHLTTLLTDKELTAEDGLRAAILEKVSRTRAPALYPPLP